jgi:hypothetical protein
MLKSIRTALGDLIVAAISAAGHSGTAILTAIESACIPLPSEVICRSQATDLDRPVQPAPGRYRRCDRLQSRLSCGPSSFERSEFGHRPVQPSCCWRERLAAVAGRT